MKTHEELQQVEHIVKMMKEHMESISIIDTEVRIITNNYLNHLKVFAKEVKIVQVELSNSISNIYKSVQEMKRISGITQDILSFATALDKLDKTLTDEKIQKVLKVIKQ